MLRDRAEDDRRLEAIGLPLAARSTGGWEGSIDDLASVQTIARTVARGRRVSETGLYIAGLKIYDSTMSVSY